jgi:hypothetical protein
LNISSLASLFNQLPKLELLKDRDDYFLLKYAPKLVQNFPSIIQVILTVYSFDSCMEFIDILVTDLPKLVYVKVNFHRGTVLNDPFASDYAIEKRRQIDRHEF